MGAPSKHCGKCGYELLGLPDIGRCPECGNPYSAIERLGLAHHNDSVGVERRTRRIRTIVLLAAAPVTVGFGGLLGLMGANLGRALGLAGVVAVLLLLGAATSYVYEKD